MKLKHQIWLDKQPKHTQEWMKKQAIWHDKDLWYFFSLGSLFGLLVGFLLGLLL
jgi:hypothetical protein